MLAANEESDAEVKWEDQQLINAFGRHTLRVDDYTETLQGKEKELQNIQDALDEMILLDSDASVNYRIGEVYLVISQDDANERLEAVKARLEGEIKDLNSKIEEVRAEMKELKTKLYGKFGKSINLD